MDNININNHNTKKNNISLNLNSNLPPNNNILLETLFKNYPKSKNSFKTQLIIEKIKITKKSKYFKFLSSYFNNPSLFLTNQYEGKQVVVGKKPTSEPKYKIPIFYKPKKQIKRNKKPIKNSNLSQFTTNTNEYSHLGLKKTVSTIETTGKLKPNQKFIDDDGINEIFNNFQIIREFNKTRNKNFITMKDIKDSNFNKLIKDGSDWEICQKISSNKNISDYGDTISKYSYINRKESNLTIINNNNNNNQQSQAQTQTQISTVKIKNQKKIKFFTINPNDNTNNNNFTNNNNYNCLNSINCNKVQDNLKTYSINWENPFSTKLIKKIQCPENLKCSTNNNNNYKNYSKENNELFQNILDKQTQYLTTDLSKTGLKEFCKILSSQEKVLLSNINSEKISQNISSAISKKIKKDKSELLMNKTESFRLNKEIKLKLNQKIKNLNPELTYKWEKNLRGIQKTEEIGGEGGIIGKVVGTPRGRDGQTKIEEIVRKPQIKKNLECLSEKKCKTMEIRNFLENPYLKEKLKKKNTKMFFNKVSKVNNNFQDLYIKGKYLLDVERDIARNLKGKKIITNYNIIYPYSHTNNNVFANDLNLANFSKGISFKKFEE